MKFLLVPLGECDFPVEIVAGLTPLSLNSILAGVVLNSLSRSKEGLIVDLDGPGMSVLKVYDETSTRSLSPKPKDGSSFNSPQK